MTTDQITTPKAYKGMAMEGPIARWYAKNARRDDEFKRYARRVNEFLAPGSSVLEVAPGPGFLSIELAKLGKYQVTGLDISKTFVEIAQTNARQAGKLTSGMAMPPICPLRMRPSISASARRISRTLRSRCGPLPRCIAS